MTGLGLNLKYKILAGCLGLSLFPNVISGAAEDNTYQQQSIMILNDGFQKCPETVTAYGKAFGLIIVDWTKYAPDTNTYITVTVVPHTIGLTSKITTDTNNNGMLTIEGHEAGFYTVYYTIQPASMTVQPCSGIEPRIVFL